MMSRNGINEDGISFSNVKSSLKKLRSHLIQMKKSPSSTGPFNCFLELQNGASYQKTSSERTNSDLFSDFF